MRTWGELSLPEPGVASRVNYRVQQRYEYAYSNEVRSLDHRLVLVPPDVHGDQRLLDYRFRVTGAEDEPSVGWSFDAFGNRVCSVRAERITPRLRFEATYEVQRMVGSVPRAPEPTSSPGWEASYLEPTGLTMPDDSLRAVARTIADQRRSMEERAVRACEWASSAIEYQAGVTNIGTPGAAALAGRFGVCQDFTHILLIVLRLLSIPARYVSGQLLGEAAPHAWVEARIPEEGRAPARYLAYDPTNRRSPDLGYITVAVGRDFQDISPTSGRFRGNADSSLTYEKRAEIVSVERDSPASASR